MSSPTQRSLAYCRSRGLDAGIVERWNAHARIRQDFMGFADLIVNDGGALAVQATSGSNAAARRAKILTNPCASRWLENGMRVEVWAWRRVVVRKKGGSRVKRWKLRRDPVTLADFEAGNVDAWGDASIEAVQDMAQAENPDKTNLAELIVAKQRNGPTGLVKLTWDSRTTRFKTHDPHAHAGFIGDVQ